MFKKNWKGLLGALLVLCLIGGGVAYLTSAGGDSGATAGDDDHDGGKKPPVVVTKKPKVPKHNKDITWLQPAPLRAEPVKVVRHITGHATGGSQVTIRAGVIQHELGATPAVVAPAGP